MSAPTTPVLSPSFQASAPPEKCPSTKNFKVAFCNLFSSYGLGPGSHAFTSSVPPESPQSSAATVTQFLSTSHPATPFALPLVENEKQMGHPSITGPSPQVFLVDLTRHSLTNAAASSTTAPKDYEAAFGALSSTYGLSGGIPSLCNTKAPAFTQMPQRPEVAPGTATTLHMKDSKTA